MDNGTRTENDRGIKDEDMNKVIYRQISAYIMH
jgi:hypothetical protein